MCLTIGLLILLSKDVIMNLYEFCSCHCCCVITQQQQQQQQQQHVVVVV